MIVIRHVAMAAIACMCPVSSVAAQDRTPVTTHVRYADLNLSNEAGRSALKARIRGAAEIACPDMGTSLADKVEAARCRSEMIRDGQMQAARLEAPADQRLALADHR